MALTTLFFVLFVFEFILGIIVLLRNIRTRANLLFFGVAFSLAMWTLSWFLFVTTKHIFWIRFSFTCGGFIISFYWLIGFYYLNLRKKINRFFLAFLVLINLSIIWLTLSGDMIVREVISITDFGYISTPGPLQPFYRGFIALGVVFAIYKLFLRIRKTDNAEKKAKLKWIFTGTLIFGIFASLSSVLGPLLLGETNITGFGPITSLPYTVFFAIAIVKYRMSDIKDSLYRGILRIATISILAAALALPLSSKAVVDYILGYSQVTLFFAIWIVVVLTYLYIAYFIPLVDRFFTRRQMQVYEIISSYRENLINVGTFRELEALIRKIITNDLGYSLQSFYFLADENGTDASAERFAAIKEALINKNRIIEYDQLRIQPDRETVEDTVLKIMGAEQADILLPFAFRHNLYALLFLQSPRPGRLLGTTQLTALDTIRTEASSVFFRIQLLHQLARSEAREFYTRELKRTNEQLSRRNMIIERDMEMARKIQRTLIPMETPGVTGLIIEQQFIPLDKIAGDFFDFIELPENKVGVFIGDVSGHGVPSALIASMAKMLLTDMSEEVLANPARLLNELNIRLIDSMDNNFITAFYGVLDIPAGVFIYSGAAHPAPLLLPKSARPEVPGNPDQEAWDKNELVPLPVIGKAIGVVHEPGYRNNRTTIAPGDRVFLFTDGCFEVFNEDEEIFGEEKLAEAIYQYRDLPLQTIGEKLVRDIQTHSANNELEDDFTLIMLETNS